MWFLIPFLIGSFLSHGLPLTHGKKDFLQHQKKQNVNEKIRVKSFEEYKRKHNLYVKKKKIEREKQLKRRRKKSPVSSKKKQELKDKAFDKRLEIDKRKYIKKRNKTKRLKKEDYFFKFPFSEG